ncbi:hypothetical protein GTQ34_13930 [Muricauda sp. JGD-17]|uniref:DUF1579 domain-containing protein n=1 Tax=Flagellimonas ochracea TaxID=2696472 RepID=A0A964TDQ7_9FLAO|nr:hypothetical protein [Allomuricauda ochracea]NAY93019.1 hypothetical protein [Allomuricauda ochracea]
MIKYALYWLFLLSLSFVYAQKDSVIGSTKDFSFLIGEWNVERIYGPKTENPRNLKGTLKCEYAANEQFVKCTYNFKRPNKSNAMDIVYLNFNGIYRRHESLWISSAWPIKVLMQGNIDFMEEELIHTSKAQFQITDTVTEYVQSTLRMKLYKALFVRDTDIKTSKDSVWHFHLREKAVKISD